MNLCSPLSGTFDPMMEPWQILLILHGCLSLQCGITKASSDATSWTSTILVWAAERACAYIWGSSVDDTRFILFFKKIWKCYWLFTCIVHIYTLRIILAHILIIYITPAPVNILIYIYLYIYVYIIPYIQRLLPFGTPLIAMKSSTKINVLKGYSLV